MATFWFIRHAESEKNMDSSVIGGRSTTSPVSRHGWKQAEALRDCLKRDKVEFDKILVSSAIRTIGTTNIVFEGDRDFIIDDRLVELDQGSWEGANRSEKYCGPVLDLIEADSYNFKAPNGESAKEVEERMMGWFQEVCHLIPDSAKKQVLTEEFGELQPYNIAVVGHGVAIKCLLRSLFGWNSCNIYYITLSNCSITKVNYWTEPFRRWTNYIDNVYHRYQLECLNFVYPEIRNLH